MAYSQTPTNFTGWYKYEPVGVDTAIINVWFMNNGAAILGGSFLMSETTTVWTPFSIDNVPVVVPVTRDDKVKYFWRILIMMKMDLQAHEAELKLAQELGEALELAENEVRGLIDYMAENVAKFISLEKFESQLIEIQKDPKYAPVKTFWQKVFPWMKN